MARRRVPRRSRCAAVARGDREIGAEPAEFDGELRPGRCGDKSVAVADARRDAAERDDGVVVRERGDAGREVADLRLEVALRDVVERMAMVLDDAVRKAHEIGLPVNRTADGGSPCARRHHRQVPLRGKADLLWRKRGGDRE